MSHFDLVEEAKKGLYNNRPRWHWKRLYIKDNFLCCWKKQEIWRLGWLRTAWKSRG